ncbi:MAG: TIGR02147 family protein [Bdellovibrionia bacterium]
MNASSQTSFPAHDAMAGDFRLYLQQELMRRCAKNPKYSLRSFAKALGLQPPTLSHILRGKRTITPTMQKKLATALSLGPEELMRFSQPETTSRISLQQLTIDAFNVVSEWHHFAILELLRVRGFEPRPKWVARALGITVSEVNVAIERLVRLELLEITKKGDWIATSGGNSTIGNEFSTIALRKVQKQFLEKSIQALETVPIEKRDQSGMTFAVNLNDLPQLKQKIKNFRRELCEYAERNPSPDEVYQLSVSFFPLSQTKE